MRGPDTSWTDDDEIIINGLRLPSRLVRLIDAGLWRRPADMTVFCGLTKVRYEEFDFLDPDGMERETDGTRRLAADAQHAEGYGLASSRAFGHPIVDPATLDVDLAVLIAVNRDEEAIFLDYRPSLDRPVVVVSTWENDGPNALRKIADNFDEFAAKIGLTGPAETDRSPRRS